MKSQKPKKEPSEILLVEDNPEHAELVVRNLEDHPSVGTIHHVSDGEAALDYLFRRKDYADPAKSPRPRVVLLDIRLPKIDGLDVLREIKNSPELRDIMVIILSSSRSESDMTQAYDSHTDGYLVKPIDFEQFSKIMDRLEAPRPEWHRSPHSREQKMATYED